MRSFAKKPKTAQSTSAAKASSAGRAPIGQDRDQHSIIQLQRAVGNQAVTQSLHPNAEATPTGLAINKPGDKYEQESDRVADQLMRMLDADEQQPGVEPLQQLQTRHIQSGSLGVTAPPSTVLDVLRSPGQPLDTATRSFMEKRFGHDFSEVRVHSDPVAGQSAEELDARAYTIDKDIAFGSGQFAPRTREGGHLLAHELTHVVQQSRSPQATTLMRQPKGSGAGKPPVPKPGHTPFNFISESPALQNWEAAVKEMLEREFKMKFSTFQEAQEHFRKHLQSLPSDAAREDFADRMRDRARKAFYRREGKSPSYAYKSQDAAKLKKGAAPESGLQLEHMEDVKTKKRGGTVIKGRPERALDPGNVYVTEGGPGGTAPKGTKHAEKYRTIDAAKKKSGEVRRTPPRASVTTEPTTAPSKPPPATSKPPSAASKPTASTSKPSSAASKPPSAVTKPPTPSPSKAPPKVAPAVKPMPASTPVRTPAAAAPRSPAPAVAPPVRPTSAWKGGLKAGGKALGVALLFAGLDYLVHRQLGIDLEKSIDQTRHGAMPWARRIKSNDESKPVYLKIKVQSKEYSRFIPLLGWMPDPPELFMSSMELVREPIDTPIVDTQDNRLNVWHPGVTITVTYTEQMIP